MGENSLRDVLVGYGVPAENISPLLSYVRSIYDSEVENRYVGLTFYIGMYIALASLVCILAMGADLLHGLRSRKLWFPCKYFRINAAFLSVIAVAMKLPVDSSDSKRGIVEQIAKIGSMAFLCTIMANLLPCLATMDNTELLINITALCISVVVHVLIEIQQGVVIYNTDRDVKIIGVDNQKVAQVTLIYVALLLVLLIIHVCSCLAILKSKKILESKYQQGHETASRILELKDQQGHETASKDIDQASPVELLTFQKLQKHVSNHWIMAESSSPQFITACFLTTSATGVICIPVLFLHTLNISWAFKIILSMDSDSDYSWSIKVILIIQSIGVVIGTIAPFSRCFAILSFKVSYKMVSNHFKVFKVESYWTGMLYDWKRADTELPIRRHRFKVLIETLKKLILSFCIGFQAGVMIVCKIIALIPFIFMLCVLYCFRFLKTIRRNSLSEHWKFGFSSLGENIENLERNVYVLHLEDEMELAETTVEGFSKSVDQLILKGINNKPSYLIELIQEKSTSSFHGVEKFATTDHLPVPSFLSEEPKDCEPKDCWSLPVVILTTIAVSLPKVEKNEVKSLVEGVREGLSYVKLVEESLNVTDAYVSTPNEARILWKEVDVDHKWLGIKLQDPSFEGKTTRQIVEWFRNTTENIDYDGKRNEDSIHMFVCANSMYGITKSILHTYHENSDDKVSQKELFDNLSSTIADIIAACLTNIPQVIILKCHTKVIEKRVSSVKDAAQLLGETEQVIKSLQCHRIPVINPRDLPFIDKWRSHMKSRIP